MIKKNSRSAPPPAMIESLESRTHLSAVPTGLEHLDKKTKKLVTPHVVLHLSRREAELGKSITFTATVTYPKRLGTLDGSVEFLGSGGVIGSVSGALSIPLPANHRVSYTFAVGNLALYVGEEDVEAGFVSNNSVPDATSKETLIGISVPKLKTASDDLQTATIIPGHGKPITAGQTATLLYTGILQSSGLVFDYATAHTPATLSFAVVAADSTQANVITGFNQGVLGMRKDETRVIAMPSQLAYGGSGQGQVIPPNADLVFIVKLLSIT